MLQLDPSNQQELAFALLKAVRQSGLTLADITRQLQDQYAVELSTSGLSHSINWGTIRLQRALQILAICGVSEIEIKVLICI